MTDQKLNCIVAQCTPSGSGAIALLRVSGPDSIKCIAQCSLLSSKKLLQDVVTHTIHHGWVVINNQEMLDEVMFIVMHAPRTFTGETTVEITCHNNQFIIEAIIQRIIACGARLAHNGEFSRQAVLNNKMDIIQAEAINDLINAHSQEALKRSLAQVQGSLSSWLQLIEKDLLKALALCEASFEFLEEDMDFSEQLKNSLTTVLTTLKHLTNNAQQNHMREGIKIAIIGSVNAGKSSLFNALLGKNRAIVTPIAGTTRDVIEASFYHDGLYWTFIDTAGLRQTDDVIEQEGIKKSHQEAAVADLVLLVVDSSRTITPEEFIVYQNLIEKFQDKIIKVKNKTDIVLEKENYNLNDKFIKLFSDALLVNNKNQDAINALKASIALFVNKLINDNNCPFLLNKRQLTLLSTCQLELESLLCLFEKTLEYELVAHHLKNILETLSELTGRSINEKMLDTIFKEFCVGK